MAPVVGNGRDRFLRASPGPKELGFTPLQATGYFDTNKHPFLDGIPFYPLFMYIFS